MQDTGLIFAMINAREDVLRSDAHHFRAVEAGWVLEGNKPVVKIIERIGFKRTRTFGIFERRLTGEGASC